MMRRHGPATAPPIPTSVRHMWAGVRRWSHPATHPVWSAAGAAVVSACTLPAWAAVLALAAVWGEGRVWPDTRRAWLSVVIGTITIGALIDPPVVAAIVALVMATAEVCVEQTARGRAMRRHRAIRDAWPHVMAAIGDPDTTVMDVDAGAVHDTITMRWPTGATAPMASAVAARVASALRTSADRVRVATGGEAGSLTVQVRHSTDPFSVPVPHPCPTGKPRNWRVPIGVNDRGKPILLDIAEAHTLVAGMSGAGKSTAVQAALVSARPLMESGDLRLDIIDMKGGMELGMWARYADRLEMGDDGSAGTLAMLRDLQREVKARQRWMRERGLREWERAVGPRRLLVIDEAAELDPASRELLRSLMNLGRATGLRVIVALQHPVKENIDRTAVLQCDQRIGMRVKDDAASRHVTNTPAVDLTTLPLAGHFFLLAGIRPRRGRIYAVVDDMLPPTPKIVDGGVVLDDTTTDDGDDVESDAPEATLSERPTPDTHCPSTAMAVPGQTAAPIDPHADPATCARPRPPTDGLSSHHAQLVDALDWGWRPIAGAKADLGWSDSTWGRHARTAEDLGLIERDGPAGMVRLSARSAADAA